MAVIPFGLVGVIYGHNVWGVPMSIFTVVGLLGMTGIIINDSIVLVTTIDEYAAERGLIPSIIDGTADRLRPVMLTTLTTVLGMAPLLYETSQQAQFLKPTVITLVYGLGFGMFLVLLVVPALMAAQHDVARQVRAMRRGVRARGLRLVLVPLWLAVLVWGAVTVGPVLVTGAMWPVVAGLSPSLAAASPGAAALVLFVVGLLGAVAAVYVLAAVGYQMARARRVG